ncbi:MAG: hypothetical protein A2289_22765 [Deltaproteobacteria bacterium RIFOXYA12_FULL_58_15]|nr:MAG: hypothetical protein A2289_22765 [Deltaproteobacteria bacterium RIFOXYA12_FULL_58_15]
MVLGRPIVWLAEDRERLAQFRRGETTTLARVFEHYAIDVAKALASGMTVVSQGQALRLKGTISSFDLDDMVHETFIAAFADKARQSYDGLRPYKPYVLAIARNVLLQSYRQDNRRQHLVDAWEQDHAAEMGPDPEESLAERQLKQLYVDFVSSLHEIDRVIMRLRFEEQVPRRRVSEETGLTAMQVRTREQKLKESFLKRMEGSGYLDTQQLAVLCLAVVLWGAELS